MALDLLQQQKQHQSYFRLVPEGLGEEGVFWDFLEHAGIEEGTWPVNPTSWTT